MKIPNPKSIKTEILPKNTHTYLIEVINDLET